MAGSQHACGSGQRMRHACDSMQRRQRICVQQRRERSAARLQWETVMAAASQQHNCNVQQRGGGAKNGGTVEKLQ
jgi:hypothetical protein